MSRIESMPGAPPEHDISCQAHDRTRHELALSYIHDTRYSVAEITCLPGFSDSSSFSRAFRRWTGISPSVYRPRSEQ
ncbi:helix-turn-helix domain-containing protein [Algiphilus sp. W345]|uniref:Helix-turn-helix domain-containing protein n=1 Tax=Banduia mediterranea TaxID=3075609 RepID=A0ABU2WLD2_9GAMM|nr:helix-turn-helix domain-containing protein [Algiphilus sp. W345]MDT0498697.1 helix-turn-helix domain-containing protein [Algiphilus sp. W345]